MENRLKTIAQEYFRGVYNNQTAVVNDLAAEEIVSSYPIFQKIFGTSVLRGKKAVRDFVAGFARRWTDAEVAIHETIAEGWNVVLIWSFKARLVDTGEEYQWGGMTLLRFNEAGRVIAEVGEESSPGPIARLAGSDR